VDVGYTLYLQSKENHSANNHRLLIAIRTPRNSKFIDEGVFEPILKRNPTGRPGKPEELANGIMFLLSPAASYINGHMLCIDGGLSTAE
jgi:NAD(P)-dependent dehydrogenase (short-subunit alcohol dehydrogenase family)